MRTACKTDALFGWQTLAGNCAIQLLKNITIITFTIEFSKCVNLKITNATAN